MTFELKEDCKEVTIYSSHLSSSATESVQVVIKLNGAEILNQSIPMTALPAQSWKKTFDTALQDGVYDVSLIVTTKELEIIEETGCLVSLCSNYCDWISTKEDLDLIYVLALALANDCPQCNCDKLKNLFKHLSDVPTTSCACCQVQSCQSCS